MVVRDPSAVLNCVAVTREIMSAELENESEEWERTVFSPLVTLMLRP